MKKRLVIFGNGDYAEVADYYFTRDSEYSVVAFVLNAQYIKEDHFKGRPVVDFETAAVFFSPANTELFVAVGYSELNAARARLCDEGKEKGYRLASYVSSRLPNLDPPNHGEHCFILEANVIQPFVTIGRNSVVWSGNHVGHHAQIGEHCFITSHVMIAGRAKIGDYSFIGGNSTIREDVVVAPRCIIGCGATITQNTKAEGVYGSPSAELRKVASSRVKL